MTDEIALLARDVRGDARFDVTHVVFGDRARRGAVARRLRAGSVQRAEPGPAGPLVLEARSTAEGVEVRVWGPPATPRDAADGALVDGAAWVGCDDDLDGFGELADAHPVLRRARACLPPQRLERLPRVGEALGRAVLAQLVQSVEARRSTAQVAARFGAPAAAGLSCWPTARQLGAVPAWELRRCGVSLRGARALHAGSVGDAALRRARGSWDTLDARLRSLPGVGVWTSAEVRLALGDPDAVSVGDYHLPGLVGYALAGDASADDAAMLALLAPFAPHRGRVIRLIERAAYRGIVPPPPRRAPRAALSAHRYW